jgi:ferredoxin-NADP reductase/DMSO/TMAO reductase YedYZ heme-binding membrane subunit
MSTSRAVDRTAPPSGGAAGRAQVPAVDGPYLKKLVIACALVPAVLLAIDAYRGHLGVNDVNYAIRSTGMLGLVFLTLSLLISPLRRLTGWHVLISVRRNLGVFGFLYILAHFTIYFLFDRGADIGSTLEEIVGRVYLWFGFGALFLMIPLAITSTDGMVSRLGPRRWKALHRLAYVAVFGGVVHFYLLVKSDTRRPFAFAVVFTGLMLFRVVREELDLRKELKSARTKVLPPKSVTPARKRFWSGELVVSRIFQETHDTKTFRFRTPDGSPLPFAHIAGQYINLKLTIEGRRVNRSYTIASSPTRPEYCEITVKRVPNGYGSHYLHDRVKESDRIKVSAPAGKFYFAGHEADRVVLVAGGVGITPCMSVVRSLTDRCWPGQIYLLFSVRQNQDVIYEHELGELQKRFPNLHVEIVVSSARGHITREIIQRHVPDLRRGPIMMCGPGPMMKAMRELLVGMGVPDEDVHEEEFVSPPMPPPGAPEPAEEELPVDGAVPSVRFAKTDKTTELPAEVTVLEAAEECGVPIPFECRSGICGQCKTKLIAGKVVMEVQDALTSGDRAKGLILACQARAARDVVVDA